MKRVDVAIIGAGVFGLRLAWALVARGARVAVLEAEAAPGVRAASSTPVGALMPFPRAEPGDPLAALQAEGLALMPQDAAALETATGGSVGYARTGRISPLPDKAARARAEAAAPAARARFAKDEALIWEVRTLGTDPDHALLAPSEAAAGVLHESVTARLDAAAYLRALSTAIELAQPGAVIVGHAVTLPSTTEEALAAGPAGPIRADQIVVAAGHQSAALCEGISPAPVRPVKGQSAMLAADLRDGRSARPVPVIQRPGLFIVQHTGGRVGVGATSEPDRSDSGTDDALDAVLERARRLVPRLAGARVLSRWSGVRPRPMGRLPVIGPVPGRQALWLATGGHGIGIALAPAMAERLADALTGQPSRLPTAFAPSHLPHGGTQ
ncbi:MAG: FAD-dependent oxidoreductase [Pseudomonadota bacterium]